MFLKNRHILVFVAFLFCGHAFAQNADGLPERYGLIIGGPGGQPEFTEKYLGQTDRIYSHLVDELGYKRENIIYLFEKKQAETGRISGISSAAEIRSAFGQFRDRMKASDQLVIFMIGHGTYDGEWAKFNLIGPDLRDIDYAQLLSTLPSQRIVLINTSSASGPFIQKVSGAERVIITATKSGAQYFETNFTDFFLDALSDEAADTDKDNRTSMFEAFNYARTQQDTWFEENRRLRAEHPLLDDNGDGKGSQSFEESEDGLWAKRVYLEPVSAELLRSQLRVQSGSMSERDRLLLKRSDLEEQIQDLKARKSQMQSQDYQKQLEVLLIELAQVSQKINAMESGTEIE